MMLLIFDVSIFRCSENVSCLTKIIPRCFRDEDCETWILSRNNGEWLIFFDFWLKKTSAAYLLGSGLKFIFLWKAQLLLILAKSLFSSFADMFISYVTEKIDVSSINSLVLEEKPVARPLMQVTVDLEWMLWELLQ